MTIFPPFFFSAKWKWQFHLNHLLIGDCWDEMSVEKSGKKMFEWHCVKLCLWGICGQHWPWSDCAYAQSDQGHCCPLTDPLYNDMISWPILCLPIYGERVILTLVWIPLAAILALASAWLFLVWTISCEPVLEFLLNFHGYINGT